ncbi:hypothetical protein [Novosphingobium album (ex Liu et al. 2023)]|uniref:DUF2029 domain-containing protein n=1 Tax=Novosphingobium album (ex Liu et al. 2023) TaxID=3031130 RepID=A0ABT5WVP2_9SPHN|nr:hypothetical protein [Novosphingobium album (ex Liu et al. 2023)]MDE8653927.1 hypothetical protein [Novosphingobium album (ex Liu et al. 2023)]
MGGNGGGAAGIVAGGTPAPADPASPRAAPAWDRFAGVSPLAARLILALLAICLAAAALVPIGTGRPEPATRSFAENLAAREGVQRPRDDDLALYDRAVERLRRGEHYYDFIVEEQRAAGFPVRPGVAVRLPTLAWINAALPVPAQVALALALMAATLIAWWRRLGEEPGGRRHRLLAMALLFVGVSLGANRYFFQLHELWSGMLLALAFGLHRPGKWGAALAVAALALAIREHALPFVLLMAAMAGWRRDAKECAAWSALALAFLALFAAHLSLVAGHVLPGDRAGQGWLMLRGLSGWLSNVVLSSNLRLLPHWLAGPAVVLMMAGSAGWRSPAGLFASLLYAGYGLLFMIAGRGDNYYWGAMVAPAMFVGLAFAPTALGSLWRAGWRPALPPVNAK